MAINNKWLSLSTQYVVDLCKELGDSTLFTRSVLLKTRRIVRLRDMSTYPVFMLTMTDHVELFRHQASAVTTCRFGFSFRPTRSRIIKFNHATRWASGNPMVTATHISSRLFTYGRTSARHDELVTKLRQALVINSVSYSAAAVYDY